MTELPMAAFREEMGDLLADLESALLDLEGMPDDGELIGRIFRALHTIKGTSAMFGLDTVATFTHEVESVFECVRNGELAVDESLVKLLLMAQDHIGVLLAAEGGEDEAAGAGAHIVAELKSRLAPA
ncbi:MAG TPA: Hpt domain-containing protein, partial [Geobacteraceae bacterium]